MGGEEENAAAKFAPGKRFGEWLIVKKLDEGGFGQVYKVEHKTKTGTFAALKAEPNDVEGGSAIKLEISVLKGLNEKGEKPHIPVVFHAAKHKKYCYMIMTLLGENLKNLKLSCKGEVMTPPSWVRIAIQCLYSVKVVHDFGFVHRDIKPNNFVMGAGDDAKRCRMVHVLDFGLARNFAYQAGGKWIPRKARGSAEFRGTLRYCSPTVHEKQEQGRKDDLWSLFYVLIELHCGLPWQTTKDKKLIETMKCHMKDADLVCNMPVEVHGVIPHLRTLDCYKRPNYTMFYEALVAILKRLNVAYGDQYDWETKEVAEARKAAYPKPLEWEDAGAYFKSDPLGVNGPPPPGLGAMSKMTTTLETVTTGQSAKT